MIRTTVLAAAMLLPLAAHAQMGAGSAATTSDPRKVEPARSPEHPADDTKGINSVAAQQMQRENQTEKAAELAAVTGPGVLAGKTVQDTQGQRVGVIDSVEGDYAVLATSKAKVRIPKSSFADQNGVLIIALSEDQVNAAANAPGSTAPTSN